jgi:tRNA threonylcarbamoyladenosine biosynthesis protein TsaB
MKILALEFSSEQRSAAVIDGSRLAGMAVDGPPAARATKAFALIDSALEQAGTAREEIETLAIGLGPGSYTGIRVAISLAQGWQLAHQVHLLGVSSVEAIVAALQEDGWRGLVHVAIDAQRQEAYLASYEVSEDACCERAALRLVAWTEVEALAAAGQTVAGPEVSLRRLQGRAVFPSAKQIGLLAADRHSFVPGEQLAPIYLRATEFIKAPPPRVL